MQVKNKNVMTHLRSLMSKMATGRSDFERIAYYRNPNSLLDEFLLGLIGLLIITILITAGFGIYFHFHIFTSAFGWAWLGVAASLVLFIVAEIVKIWFGLNFVRAVLSGTFWKSLHHLAFITGIALLVFFAFRWSIGISTKAIADVNRNIH